jgi:hypothetical protein
MWVDYIDAPLGSIVRFRLSVHNNIPDPPIPIMVWGFEDLLPPCLEYADNAMLWHPGIGWIPYEPDYNSGYDPLYGTYLGWYDLFPMSLMYCEWIYLEFDAFVLGPPCVENINEAWSYITADIPPFEWYPYDTATVHPFDPSADCEVICEKWVWDDISGMWVDFTYLPYGETTQMLITVTNIGTVTVQDSYLYDYMEGSFIYANNAQVWDPTGSHYYYEPDYLYVDPVTGETWMTWEFGYNLAPGESYSVMFDVVAVGDPCEVDYNYAEADYYCPPTSQYEYTNEDDASVEVQGTVWNVDKEIWYCTIQDAVDDADSCNTIVAYPAVYEEQVYINIDLTLIGMDGAIIVPPDSPRTTYTFPESSNTFDPIIFANGEGGIISVDVIGFDIDGLNKADNTPRFVGILYRNVQPGTHMALIAENTIFNMYDPDGEGDGPQTSGILVYGDSYVYIEDNHVVDFSRLGIGALGDDSWRDDPFVEISGNLVIGNGFEPMTGWWADNGIQIGYGAGGIVSENTLDDFYSNSAWYSTAILIYDAASGV